MTDLKILQGEPQGELKGKRGGMRRIQVKGRKFGYKAGLAFVAVKEYPGENA